MVGIYKIENLINHHCYIGQSVNIIKRLNDHKTTAFNQNSHNYDYPIYRAIRKYGIKNFSFEILEECPTEKLNEKEIFYIQKYNSFFNGYNQTLGGDGGVCTLNKEKIIGIINDLENTIMSHKQIADKWDFSVEMVQGINTGRYWHHDRSYPIQNPKAQFLRKNQACSGKSKYEWVCIDCGKQVAYKSLRCRDCENKRRREEHILPVTREELKKLIRTTPFTTIGKLYNVTDNAIRKWCDKYNLPRKSSEIKQISDEDWLNI